MVETKTDTKPDQKTVDNLTLDVSALLDKVERLSNSTNSTNTATTHPLSSNSQAEAISAEVSKVVDEYSDREHRRCNVIMQFERSKFRKQRREKTTQRPICVTELSECIGTTNLTVNEVVRLGKRTETDY